MSIKVVIIEDEEGAQIYLNELLQTISPKIEVLKICDDLPSGIIAIRKLKPDLVFLDIEMPKYKGLEIVNFFDIEEIDFSIIFTTAYDQYAIQAFKTPAIDYLLKPIDPEELESAIKRFYKRNPKIAMSPSYTDAKIAIPDGNSLQMVAINDILYLKAENTYTLLILTNGKSLITSRLLKNFEESLKNFNIFLRCHKSYIINTNYIESYGKSNGGFVSLSNKVEIPVSVEKTEELLSFFIKVVR
ncbi:MAG: LytTR family DNA-binding domain-containing protein [Thermonemataceae bacterium]|nr:LytTR family DNA-binding domain-containing protein [Thermonemataceae bacterium]